MGIETKITLKHIVLGYKIDDKNYLALNCLITVVGFSIYKSYIYRRRTFERNDNPKERKKKWAFERKKNNPKERNLKNQMDIWAKEKQPKRTKSKKLDGHLSERKIIQERNLINQMDIWAGKKRLLNEMLCTSTSSVSQIYVCCPLLTTGRWK